MTKLKLILGVGAPLALGLRRNRDCQARPVQLRPGVLKGAARVCFLLLGRRGFCGAGFQTFKTVEILVASSSTAVRFANARASANGDQHA